MTRTPKNLNLKTKKSPVTPISPTTRIEVALEAMSWPSTDKDGNKITHKYCHPWQKNLLTAMDALKVEKLPDVIIGSLPWGKLPGLERLNDLSSPDIVGFWAIQFPRACEANPNLGEVATPIRQQVLLMSAVNAVLRRVEFGTWAQVSKPIAILLAILQTVGSEKQDKISVTVPAITKWRQGTQQPALPEWIKLGHGAEVVEGDEADE